MMSCLVVLLGLLLGVSVAATTCGADGGNAMEPSVLSWAPKLVHLPGFWNASVCDHVKAFVQNNVREQASTTDTSSEEMLAIRRSSSFWLEREQEYGEAADPLIKHAVLKMHERVMLPPYHGEELQVTRYREGDYYEFHHDTDDKTATMVTFIVYLNDVHSGGETLFPFIKNPHFNESTAAAHDEPLPPPVDPRKPGSPVAAMDPYCQVCSLSPQNP